MARFIDELKRTQDCGGLRASDIDSEVVLFGWVANRRDHGSIIFIDLRDRRGITQIVFDPDLCREAHTLAEAVRGEWVIGIRGVVRSRGEQFSKKESNRFLEITTRSGRHEFLYRGDLISGAIIAASPSTASTMPSIRKAFQCSCTAARILDCRSAISWGRVMANLRCWRRSVTP